MGMLVFKHLENGKIFQIDTRVYVSKDGQEVSVNQEIFDGTKTFSKQNVTLSRSVFESLMDKVNLFSKNVNE
jgi:catalase